MEYRNIFLELQLADTYLTLFRYSLWTSFFRFGMDIISSPSVGINERYSNTLQQDQKNGCNDNIIASDIVKTESKVSSR